MAGGASDVSSSELPESVSDWLAQLAAEQDVSEEDLLSRLLEASTDGDVPALPELDERLAEVQSDLGDVETRIEGLEADTREKIDDVRERVIQVKRDADAKADPDHDHPDLESEIADLDDDVAALFEELDDVEESLGASIEQVSTETEDLREEVETVAEDASEKLTVLAVAVVEMRDQVRELLADRRERVLAAELREAANRADVRRAACESCETGVDVGLLTEPRCPHCNEPFEELDPKDGFFGTNYLRTGHAPALEPGETDGEDSELEEIIEE
jgi:chromosome segregation ATPase